MSRPVDVSASGVNVRAQAGTWRGARSITDDITPVFISIRNFSGKTMVLALTHLALLGPDRRRYAALPLYEIEGTGIQLKVSAGRYQPVTTPYFKHVGFNVVSHYAPLYPSVGTTRLGQHVTPDVAARSYNYRYYRKYQTYLRKVDLPTPDMRNRAIPEGTIDDRGLVAGYVYFEKVDPERSRVTLVCTLVDATTGTTFGEAKMLIDLPEHLRVAPSGAD
jgi:hypothetical protein